MSSYLELARSFVPSFGDVVLAIVGATLGKTALIPEMSTRFHIQRSVAIFRTIKAKVLPEYLNLVFQSSAFQRLLWRNVGFSAQPGIYLGTLVDISIALPTTEEQAEIIKTTYRLLSSLDKLAHEASDAASLLHERRTALISAAVTGKIDVRGLVPEISTTPTEAARAQA